MNTYGGCEGIAPQFLTSALYGGERSSSRPCRLTPGETGPGTRCTGGLVGPKAGVDIMEKKAKISCPCQESNPRLFDLPACRRVAKPTELSRFGHKF
jgi:hypothetical protein